MVLTSSYSSKNINKSMPNLSLNKKYASPSHGNARHVEHGLANITWGSEEKHSVEHTPI